MKSIKASINGYDSIYKYGKRLRFSLLSSPETGSKQIIALSPCRDFINDCVIQYVNRDCKEFKNKTRRGYTAEWDHKINTPVDFDHMRLLLAYGDDLTDKQKHHAEELLQCAVRIINKYETVAGWREKSALAKVVFTDSKMNNCWAIVGSKKWMKSTHLISMVTLIARTVVNNPSLLKCQSLKSVESEFERLCKPKTDYCDDDDLHSYLPKAFPKFRMIMRNYRRLFGRFNTNEFYPESQVFDWHGTGGIVSLCSFRTDITDLDRRMKKLWESWSVCR